MPTDQVLKVQEFAERLRIHPETVREWLRTGKVRGTRLGGNRAGWRIAESEVDRLLNSGDGSPDGIMPPDRDTTTDARDGART